MNYFSKKRVIVIFFVALNINLIGFNEGWEPVDLKSGSSVSLKQIDTDSFDWGCDSSTQSETSSHEPPVTPPFIDSSCDSDKYDKITEFYYDYSTGDFYYQETYLDRNRQSDFDLELPPCNDTVVENGTIIQEQDYFNDFTRDQRLQGIADHETSFHNTSLHKVASKRIIKELELPVGARLTHVSMDDKVLDSTLILDQVHNVDHLIMALYSPIVRARFQRERYDLSNANFKRHRSRRSLIAKEIAYIDVLLSGKVQHLLQELKHNDLRVAQSAFNELQLLWPWQREHSFLLPSGSANGEIHFVRSLGVDIMEIAEVALVSRQDYVLHHANGQELKAIQDFRNECIELQKNGNLLGLSGKRLELFNVIVAEKIKKDFAADTCLAIVDYIEHDPVTRMFAKICRGHSLADARESLKEFELYLLNEMQQQNALSRQEIEKFVLNKYNFDVLDVAYRAYESRSDYVDGQENLLLFSDKLAVCESVKSDDLLQAHKTLINFKAESLNKGADEDVVHFIRNIYVNRPDHKELIDHYIPVNISNCTIAILENNRDQVVVAHELTQVAEQVFNNARHANMHFIADVELQVNESLDIIRTTPYRDILIINIAAVDHVLNDVQSQVNAIVTGSPTIIERSSELFVRAVTKFVTALNPITQAENMYDFATDVVHVAGKVMNIAIDAAQDPYATAEKAMVITEATCDFLVNTACFLSDVTVGRYYLSPQDYQQRIDMFWDAVDQMPVEYFTQLTAENWVDLGAQVAADFVFCKGLSGAIVYLKEIDAINNIQRQASTVASKLKKAVDVHLAEEPIVVTAEGIVFKMSSEVTELGGVAKEVIGSSRALLESIYAKVAVDLEKDIERIRKIYEGKVFGFGDIANKQIKIDYAHILGIQFNFNQRGTLKLSGFHHDFKNIIEQIGVLDFANKVLYKHGFYSAEILYNGSIAKKKSTFFPADWSREQVISKIYEAYNDFAKNGAIVKKEVGGKYVISGIIQEGIEIEMYVTKNGQITTAYPIF